MNKANLIRLLTFLGGIYFILEFLLPQELFGYRLGKYHEQISDGFIAMGSMSVGLGIINLCMVHGSRIVFNRKGAFISAALLAGLFGMLTLTILEWRSNEQFAARSAPFFNLADFATRIVQDEQTKAVGVLPWTKRTELLIQALDGLTGTVRQDIRQIDTAEFPEALGVRARMEEAVGKTTAAADALDTHVLSQREVIVSGEFRADRLNTLSALLRDVGVSQTETLSLQSEQSAIHRLYSLLYDGLFVALGSAMFALLGFYIAAAAYRAFRVKTFESSLMMTAALLVMLGQIPFGLWIWSGFPELRQWLLEIPSSGAFRAIKFGAAIASLAMAFRMLFSIETKSFSRQER